MATIIERIQELQKDKRLEGNQEAIDALKNVEALCPKETVEKKNIKNASDTYDIILGTMNVKSADVFTTPINNHICVIGPTGSGKTRNFVLPNMLQVAKQRHSMVIVDLAGGLYERTANLFAEQGYTIVRLNDENESVQEPFDFAVMRDAPYACFCTINGCDKESLCTVRTLLNNGLKRLQEDVTEDKLPVHFFLDEFIALGKLDVFLSKGYMRTVKRKLNRCRSNRIYLYMVFQSVRQLKATYPDEWEDILRKGSSVLFLGSSDAETLMFLSSLMNRDERSKPLARVRGAIKRKDTRSILDSELSSMKPNECMIFAPGKEHTKLFKFDPSTCDALSGECS